MCLRTKTIYTDHSAHHASYFHGKEPLKCKKARVNEARIEGVCGDFLEPYLDASMGRNLRRTAGIRALA
jgi:hypothetical protein